MSNFMTLCKEVSWILKHGWNNIQTTEAFGTDRVDVSIWELHVSLSQLECPEAWPSDVAEVETPPTQPTYRMVLLIALRKRTGLLEYVGTQRALLRS